MESLFAIWTGYVRKKSLQWLKHHMQSVGLPYVRCFKVILDRSTQAYSIQLTPRKVFSYRAVCVSLPLISESWGKELLFSVCIFCGRGELL